MNFTTITNPFLGKLRGTTINGETWFLAGSVCDALKLKDSKSVIEELNLRHLKYKDTAYVKEMIVNGQSTYLIRESVVYELMFQSTTKKAFDFQQMVYKEILPMERSRRYLSSNKKNIVRRAVIKQKASSSDMEKKAHIENAIRSMQIEGRSQWEIDELARQLEN